MTGAEGGLPGSTRAPRCRRDPGIYSRSIYELDLTSATAAPVRLSPAVADGHNGISDGYIVTADERVIYRADQGTAGIVDAYLADATAVTITQRKVSPALDATTDSDAVSKLSPVP